MSLLTACLMLATFFVLGRFSLEPVVHAASVDHLLGGSLSSGSDDLLEHVRVVLPSLDLRPLFRSLVGRTAILMRGLLAFFVRRVFVTVVLNFLVAILFFVVILLVVIFIVIFLLLIFIVCFLASLGRLLVLRTWLSLMRSGLRHVLAVWRELVRHLH